MLSNNFMMNELNLVKKKSSVIVFQKAQYKNTFQNVDQQRYKEKFFKIQNNSENITKKIPANKAEPFDLANIAKMQEILSRQNLVDLVSFESVNPSVRNEEMWIRVTQKYHYVFAVAFAMIYNGQLKIIVQALEAPINLTKFDEQAFREAFVKEINPIYEKAIIETMYHDEYKRKKPLPVYDFKLNRFTGERTLQMWV